MVEHDFILWTDRFVYNGCVFIILNDFILSLTTLSILNQLIFDNYDHDKAIYNSNIKKNTI